MERTIIGFEPDQLDALRRVAEERGVSVASLVRAAVAEHLERLERDAKWERAMALAGAFREIPGWRDAKVEPGKQHDLDYALAIDEKIERKRRRV
jgi:hypothetical protein